jgi:hypothetical protein
MHCRMTLVGVEFIPENGGTLEWEVEEIMARSKIANARCVYMVTAFSDAEATKLMAWIERQDPKPTKSEAIRNFVLAAIGKPTTR